MARTTTNEVLENGIYPGAPTATELLYNKYGGMIFSFILQFERDRQRAEGLLADVFLTLHDRLEEACRTSQSLYCWLQAETRKIILQGSEGSDLPASKIQGVGRAANGIGRQEAGVGMERSGVGMQRSGERESYYFALLEDAGPEHQWVFRELYLYGRDREELALQVDKDVEYISKLLRESLLIIRKKLG